MQMIPVIPASGQVQQNPVNRSSQRPVGFAESLASATREVRERAPEAETREKPTGETEVKRQAQPEGKPQECANAGAGSNKAAAGTDSLTTPVAEDTVQGETGTVEKTVNQQVNDELLKLLQQLMSFLNTQGITGDQDQAALNVTGGNIETGAQVLSGGLSGQVELQKLMTALGSGETGVSAETLSQVLKQLTLLLEQKGRITPEMGQLKALLETQLNQPEGIEPTGFVQKLADLIKVLSAATGQSGEEVSQAAAGQAKPTVDTAAGTGRVAGEDKAANVAKVAETAETLPRVTVETKGVPRENTDSKPSFDQTTDGNGSKQPEGNPAVRETRTGTKLADGPVELAGTKPEHPASSIPSQAKTVEPQFMTLQGELQRVSQNQAVKTAEPVVNIPRMSQVILGQITQKAKLVVTPGLTEMQIQLKPEFLGKLNLSISSENGTVTAKFNAESYRVKEVIEANLNTLKDALAQQGIKVDQLLVSVSTEKDYSAFREQQNGYWQNGTGKNAGTGLNEEEIDRIFAAETQPSVVSQIYGNTVDFTA